LNIAGANVTVPYKEKVIPFLDILSEGANIIGAINTIVCNSGTLKGYNTNAIGFMDALSEADFEVAGKSALVFGTGGAAKAVVFMLNWLRAASIRVAGRSPDKTAGIAERFEVEGCSIDELVNQSIAADIVVNATSVSSPQEAPELGASIQKLQVSGCQLVLDLNYGRSQNFWQDMARCKGIRFMDGLPALAFQARRTLALWTRVQVAPEEFLNALKEG
jgi:shikimate dehydrogenase